MKKSEMKKFSLLAEVACSYYERGYNEEEISRQLNISRTRISRLLKEAREKGIISISINYDFERVYELEERLKERFDLRDARVLNNRNRPSENIPQEVGRLAADYFYEVLKKDMIIGMSWGTTLADFVSCLKFVPFHVSVVQLIGSVPCSSISHTPQGIVTETARRLSATGSLLSVPLYVQDNTARAVLKNDINNRKVLNQGLLSDIIVTSVSDINSVMGKEFWTEYLSHEFLDEAVSRGAIGSVFGRFYNEKGEEIDCKWNNRLVGISLKQMKEAPLVIGIITGKEKVAAALGALNGRMLDTLVTDGTTATRILGMGTIN